MSNKLQRRYELFLKAYPEPYRTERGSEIIDTLVERSSGKRNGISLREAWSLVKGGLRTRAWMACGNSVSKIWLGGLWMLAVFVLADNSITELRFNWGSFNEGTSPLEPRGVLYLILPILCIAAMTLFVLGKLLLSTVFLAAVTVLQIADSYQLGFLEKGSIVSFLLWLLLPVALVTLFLFTRPNEVTQLRSPKWLFIAIVPLIISEIESRFITGPWEQVICFAILWVLIPLVLVLLFINSDPRMIIGISLYSISFSLILATSYAERMWTLDFPGVYLNFYLILHSAQLVIGTIGVIIASRSAKNLALVI